MNKQKEGYTFIPSGDPAKTRLAKATPGAIEEVVFRGRFKRRVGFWVPNEAVQGINQKLVETTNKREGQRQQSKKQREKKEAQYRLEFESVLNRLFPSMPEPDRKAIVGRATKVGGGTVGRTTLLEIEDKATLATVAHVRHKHTCYDQLLKNQSRFESLLDKGYSKAEARDEIRDAARDEVQSEIENVLARWRGPVGS